MKQVILMRKDLKMRRGKEIAQGSHASMSFLLKGESPNNKDVKKWMETGQTKICLQIHSEEELLEIYQQALNLGLRANIITDAGRTEFNGVPTKTCVAIGPNESNDIDKITRHLKLY
jgi:PTH2 family peptidyl-tRNA hydrolase